MQKYKKEVVATFDRELDGEQFSVLVLDDKDYYNIHVISERYKADEMNTLSQQISKESMSKDSFTTAKLIGYLMEHFIWDRFYDLGMLSSSITIDIEEH